MTLTTQSKGKETDTDNIQDNGQEVNMQDSEEFLPQRGIENWTLSTNMNFVKALISNLGRERAIRICFLPSIDIQQRSK